MRLLDATSRTLMLCGSLPSATTRVTMSRSVSVPTSRWPSTTGARPTFSSFSIRAAYETVWSASMVHGLDVIASWTLFPMEAPSYFGVIFGFPAPVGAKPPEWGSAVGHDRATDQGCGTRVPGGVRRPALGRLPGLQGRPEQGLRD